MVAASAILTTSGGNQPRSLSGTKIDYLPVVRILRDGRSLPIQAGRIVVYGSFDGFHVGHQRMLHEMSGVASDRRFALLDEALIDGPRLSSRRHGLEELAACGFAGVLIRTAQSGLDAALAALKPTEIVRSATEHCPTEIAEFPVVRAVEAPLLAGTPVTSQRLRAAVVAGSLDEAKTMIGRSYSVDGRVVHGHHRGATIGVPTANLHVREQQLPPEGVYAVTVRTGVFTGVGVANLGTAPTFGNAVRTLETHIFDFEGDLYGSRLTVGFVQRLRGERKFDGIEALVAQIRQDADAARAIHERR